MKYPTTEKEYRAYNAINFSSLSSLSDSPKWYRYEQLNKDDSKWDKSYFHIGSAFDALLTEGMEALENEFVVGTVEPTNAKLLGFCDYYIHALWDGQSKDVALQIAKQKSGYKITVKALKGKLEGAYATYVEEKLASKGKKFLLPGQMELILKMYENFKDTPEVSKWFIARADEFGIERHFQKPIIFSIEGIECKALLDCLYIDHVNKKIYPIDLKTTSKNVESFYGSFEKYKYYLQAAFYTEAVRQWVFSETLAAASGFGTDFTGYEIMPFSFAVCEKSLYNKPLMYVCTENTLEKGRTGGVVKGTSKRVKGYEQLIYDMLWHRDQNLWDFPREVYESSLVKVLDVFE